MVAHDDHIETRDDEPNNLARTIGAAASGGNNDDNFVVSDDEVDSGEKKVDNQEEAKESDGSIHDINIDTKGSPADESDADAYAAESHTFNAIASSILHLMDTAVDPVQPLPSERAINTTLTSNLLPEGMESVGNAAEGNQMRTRKRHT